MARRSIVLTDGTPVVLKPDDAALILRADGESFLLLPDRSDDDLVTSDNPEVVMTILSVVAHDEELWEYCYRKIMEEHLPELKRRNLKLVK